MAGLIDLSGSAALLALCGVAGALILARLAVEALPRPKLAAKAISPSTLAQQEFIHER